MKPLDFNLLRVSVLTWSLGALLVVACDDSGGGSDAAAHEHEHADSDEHGHEHGDSHDAGSDSGRAEQRDAGGEGSEHDAGAAVSGTGGGGGAGGKGGAGGMGGAGSSASAAGAGGAGGMTGGAGGTNPEGTKPVTVRFRARVGEQDFACGTNYDNFGSNGSTVTPQDMRMFIQELSLIETDGNRVPVTLDVRAPWQSETVALLDFEDQTGNCVDGTRATNTELTGRVAEGTYVGISFKSGVPEDLNHADPTTLSDPLATSATLRWSWIAGFRFAKIELANTVPGENDLGRAYFHPGTTGCTGNPMQGTVTCVKPNRNEVVFDVFDPDTDTIVIDVAELFKNTDLEQASECHSTPQNICGPMFDAWGINWANGATKAGQTVFKLE